MITTEMYQEYYISEMKYSENSVFSGLGISKTKEESIIAAKAEMLERMISINDKKENLCCFSFLENNHLQIPFSQLQDLCDDELPSTEIHWTNVTSLKKGKEYLIPACVVYFAFGRDKISPVKTQSSVGLSAHRTVTEAINKSVYEILERHFYYKAWAGLVDIYLINTTGNMSTYFIRNPVGCNIILALLQNDVPPYTTAGICAHHDARYAIDHATREAWLGSWVAKKWIDRLSQSNAETTLKKQIAQPFIAHAFDAALSEQVKTWQKKIRLNRFNGKFYHSYTLGNVFDQFEDIYIKILSTSTDTGFYILRSIIPGAMTHRDSHKALEVLKGFDLPFF